MRTEHATGNDNSEWQAKAVGAAPDDPRSTTDSLTRGKEFGREEFCKRENSARENI